ncbi:MAG: hypothetical protein IKC69_02620 [Clostridia bacterium]|nr:hypothetical protein [Clostridia bacterium]
MKIQVNAKKKIGTYKDPTRWMNSTLRYVPPKGFPAFLESRLGKAAIMRTFVTLDEYWDYRTDTTYPDYEIGKLRYPVSELHYVYDMALIVPAPSGTRFRDYLVEHGKCAEELLLNVRRYEREVSDGIITYDQYEAVFERAVEYCKELAPNIRYIECCNEVDIKPFGNLTAEEYVKIYLRAKSAIDRLNQKHHYEIPLVMGGFSQAHPLSRWPLMQGVAAGLKKAGVEMDFYSYHMYDDPENRALIAQGLPETTRLSGVEKLREILRRHRELLQENGLEEKPVFLNETGRARATGVDGDSIHNAAGLLTYLIAFSEGALGEMLPFPWCSFHNPELQISYTQYLLQESGSYGATPNGMALEMLHSLSGSLWELSVTESAYPDAAYTAIAVKNGEDLFVLAVNPEASSYPATLILEGLEDGIYQMELSRCNHLDNNIVTGKNKSGRLEVTHTLQTEIKNGILTHTEVLDKDCFVLIHIAKAEEVK